MGPLISPLKAVLFDRDGTLIQDVPYNHDPALVRPMPGARTALDRLRAEGVRLGVVTNQSGIAKRLIVEAELREVNRRVELLLGRFQTWAVCRHAELDHCACRKPAPGLVRRAAAQLHVPLETCVVVGDIGSDVEAGTAAGAATVLVPTDETKPDEIDNAEHVAPDLAAAVDLILGVS